LTAEWRPGSTLTFEAKEVFSDARIDTVAFQPELNGKQLAGVPRHSALFSATWDVSPKLTSSAAVRAYGTEFQDAENTLRISAATVVKFHFSYKLTKMFEAFINVENLTNARIETDRSANGFIYTGLPVMFFEGIRVTW
jgi:outer membrane receptor protein involved in Fe transport